MSSRATTLLCLLLALALALLGCTQVYGYPEIAAEETAALCDDGVDNDFDGKSDCEDSQCNRFCVEDTEALCHDGMDNDFDGREDCESEGCARYCVEGTAETCRDRKDNDQSGRADCADPACAAHCPEASATTCADRTDNDSDGDIDCDDLDCDGHCPEQSARDCDDARDNDGDGLTDAADPRCWEFALPAVQRCARAPGADIVETFDIAELNGGESTDWQVYGRKQGAADTDFVAHSGRFGARRDARAIFNGNTTGAGALDDNLGEIVRNFQFTGRWEGFALAFRVAVPPGSGLKVGIVPAELAPFTKPTLPDGDAALLAVVLDGSRDPAVFALDVGGARVETELPLDPSQCEGDATDCETLRAVEVVWDDGELRASITGADGERTELRGPAPAGAVVPPSRLVVWGGSIEPASSAVLDDLRLHLDPYDPCGYGAPQIPGASCEHSDALRSFGLSVALAEDDAGVHCALVTASANLDARGPRALTAWTSEDGQTFAPAPGSDGPLVEIPDGAEPIGAGIAHDDDGFHVAVAYRDGARVRLGFASGRKCGAWGAIAEGPALYPDAEAPSYVIAGGEHLVFFTRPPTETAERTLWRVARSEDGSEWLPPELRAELPEDAAAPVSVRAIGARDLVLVHPIDRPDAGRGIGWLVGDAAGYAWSRGAAPLLDVPRAFRNESGGLAFDERGVASAALAWGPAGGFLLYGASTGIGFATYAVQSRFTVGTARMAVAGEPLAEAGTTAVPHCGDGACTADEACSTCPADCDCGGATVLSDVFTAEAGWQLPAPAPATFQYLDPDRGALNWASGPSSWSALHLDRALNGDFELSFDVTVFDNGFVAMSPECSLYVGLGSLTEGATLEESGGAAIADGAFARLSYDPLCWAKYQATPFVQSGEHVFGEDPALSTECTATDQPFTIGAKRRVALVREGNRMTVESAREDSCGTFAQSVEYEGALSPLSTLIVGFGGGAFGACSAGEGAGSIGDLRIRLLEDPEACPSGAILCDEAGQQPTCVDTRRSPEHCGACGSACGAHALCVEGSCTCVDAEGILACGDACVDSRTDPLHCGACDHACDNGDCVDGACFIPTGDCSAPFPLLLDDEGTALVGFMPAATDVTEVCGLPVAAAVAFSWRAEQSGSIGLVVQSANPEVLVLAAVTEDATCSAWNACTDEVLGEGAYFTTVPVTEGVTYRIAVGLAGGDPATDRALIGVIEL